MQKQISSLQNPLIKQVSTLQEKSRDRRKLGLFVIEGLREIQLAFQGGYLFKKILFCSKIISEDAILKLENQLNESIEFIEISEEVYKKIAYRNSTEGIVALAESKDLNLSNLKFESKNPLILIAEAPEKPGNIGAILRTADAANLDAVIIANPKSDMYNPNVIRSSVGGIFTNQIAVGSTSEIIKFLKTNDINCFCAALQASIPYTNCNFKSATAIIVGTEATGLSQEWMGSSSQNIIIPMNGKLDSMNVSVAAGILIFEAVRQRIQSLSLD